MAAAQAFSDKQQSMPASARTATSWTSGPICQRPTSETTSWRSTRLSGCESPEYLDDDGVIRRMPLHDRFQCVDVSEVAKYELPSRNRKRKGVPAYVPRPVTDGWRVSYVLAPLSRAACGR